MNFFDQIAKVKKVYQQFSFFKQEYKNLQLLYPSLKKLDPLLKNFSVKEKKELISLVENNPKAFKRLVLSEHLLFLLSAGEELMKNPSLLSLIKKQGLIKGELGKIFLDKISFHPQIFSSLLQKRLMLESSKNENDDKEILLDILREISSYFE